MELAPIMLSVSIFANLLAKIVKVEQNTKKKPIFFFYCRGASYLRRSQRYELVGRIQRENKRILFFFVEDEVGESVSCVARDAALPLLRPKGLKRRRLYPCTAPFTPEGPYTPQAIPPCYSPSFHPSPITDYRLQFCRGGVKESENEGYYLYIIYTYIIYIIVNIFTCIF
jgi:hypothetical protein